VSCTNRTRVPELESTYRNQMIEHEPKPHISTFVRRVPNSHAETWKETASVAGNGL
jgi:hypothetical protein